MSQRIRLCTSRDGARIAYATHGRGTPLVKVAHWLTHLERDWESPVWRHWLDALGERHTVVRYDNRDTGLSDRDVDRICLDAWVEDLEAVVDDAGLERFPLLAMCQAGPVAVEYAVRHPERVSALVCVGTYARGRLRRDASEREKRNIDALMTLIGDAWGADNASIRQLWTSRFIPGGTLEQMRWFNDMQRWSASAAATLRSMQARYELDVLDRAREVSAPTLVLHSRGDALVPFENGRELAASIPAAGFVPLDSDNHVLLADEPAWPRFLAVFDEFIGVPGPLPRAFAELTARERELLDLVAAGLSNAEVAARLVISEKTVRNHITHVFGKLGVTGRAQAIVLARDAGLGCGSGRGRTAWDHGPTKTGAGAPS